VEREAAERTLQRELDSLRRDYREIEPQLNRLAELTAHLEATEAALAAREARIAELETLARSREEKADALRRNAFELRNEQNETRSERDRLRAELAALSDVQSHIAYLSRFTTYTRSRSDYERSVLTLSPEQQDALERIPSSGDYLITGSAGTGKTLVLLHALDRDLALTDQELGITAEKPFALLTYTKTLVRFSTYLSQIMGSHRTVPVIATVDAFLLSRLKQIRDDAWIVFPGKLVGEYESVFEQYARSLNMAEPELADHLEAAFHSGNVPTELADAHRALVAAMEERGGYSKGYAAQTIRAAVGRADLPDLAVRRIFVDESQDLGPVDIATLRALSPDGLVLAGDRNQGIYRTTGSLREAGISVQGRSRVLRRNWRNTEAICSLAETYRSGAGEQSDIVASRRGPEPELYYADSSDAATDLILRRCRFFIDQIGYEPENIAVLVPGNDDLKMLLPHFQVAGIPTSNLKSASFDFARTSGVRLSTMHSAKGVEFPLVILYLPGFTVRPEYSAEQAEALQRNLVYVAMTRAMDHLQIIVRDTAAEPAIRDLVLAFERSGRQNVPATPAETPEG
jgi:hypothetical protein